MPTALAPVVLAVFAVACGGPDATGAGGPTTTADVPATTADVPATTAPSVVAVGAEPTCEARELVGRAVEVCRPDGVETRGLVIALHGRGSSPAGMRAVTGLEHPAAAEGLAVAYPSGLGGGWGDDTFSTPERPAGDEDVRFLDAVVDELRSELAFPDAPVGVVGFSNGASMALRYGAARADEVDAVVAVAGQLPRDPAVHPTSAVPLLVVYGSADPIRSYDDGIPATPERIPGQPTPTLSSPDSVAAFVAVAGDGIERHDPVEGDPDPGDATTLRTERWDGPDGIVAVLHTVVGGGHTWPSALAPSNERFGPVSQDLDASAEAIAFVVEAAALSPAGSPDRGGDR